jgi:hypothetical protein
MWYICSVSSAKVYISVYISWFFLGLPALLNLNHISPAYELLPAVSIVIPNDMQFRILRWWHLTWEITSAHKELQHRSSCAHQSWILSYLFTHDSQAQLFAEFRSFSFHCVLTFFPPELAGWVCHWRWKCPFLFRNFSGWGLVSLSEDSCQNYSVIAVELNALRIYVLLAYGSSAHFLFLLPVNPVSCFCVSFFFSNK